MQAAWRRNRGFVMPIDTATAQRLYDDCARLGVRLAVHEHAPVFTIDESAAVHRAVPGAHTRNLFLKDHKGRFWLATLPHHARADLRHLATALGSGRLRFASADDLDRLLGLIPGSVTPLGAISDVGAEVTVAIDQSLVEAGTIAVHPLRNTATVVLAAADLVALLRHWRHDPIVAPLVASDGNGVSHRP